MAIVPKPLNAVVLAGGINRIDLFKGYAPGYKALLPFAGRPSVHYVLEALGAVSAVGRICLVGPEEELRRAVGRPSSYDFVPAGKSLLESLSNGLEHFRGSAQVLIVTADLPLITPRSVADFIEECAMIETSSRDNLFWAMVPEGCYLGTWPEAAKGFNRFRDIAVCHGNLLMANPGLLDNNRLMKRVDALYHARKNSVRVALAVGWKVGLGYLFGVHLWKFFTLAQMAGIVSRRFGVGLHAVLLEYPEVAIDVDEPRDYLFVKQRLERKTKPACPPEIGH